MARRADLSKAKNRASNSKVAESILKQQTQDTSYIPLSKIATRPTGDTRDLNPTHVTELVNSISAIGLISPLTVDSKYQLLAGGHRREALSHIFEQNPDRYHELFPDGVPVRVMAIDADTDIVDALQIEIEENTQRRNYTATEIREAALKLEKAGYEKLKGRPAAGQKSLNRELMTVFRLSRRRITDILNEPSSKSEQGCSLLDELQGYLKKTVRLYESIDLSSSSNEIQKVEKDMGKLIVSLRKAIKHEEQKAQQAAKAN